MQQFNGLVKRGGDFPDFDINLVYFVSADIVFSDKGSQFGKRQLRAGQLRSHAKVIDRKAENRRAEYPVDPYLEIHGVSLGAEAYAGREFTYLSFGLPRRSVGICLRDEPMRRSPAASAAARRHFRRGDG